MYVLFNKLYTCITLMCNLHKYTQNYNFLRVCIKDKINAVLRIIVVQNFHAACQWIDLNIPGSVGTTLQRPLI